MWGYVEYAGLALDHDGLCFVRGARDQSDAAGFFVFNLRANPLGSGACLAKAAPGENEPGVPVAFGWELGVAGVEGPDVVQLDGQGVRKDTLNNLDGVRACRARQRHQIVGSCREVTGSGECQKGFNVRRHSMYRGNHRRLPNGTGRSVRASCACALRSRASSCGVPPAVRSWL